MRVTAHRNAEVRSQPNQRIAADGMDILVLSLSLSASAQSNCYLHSFSNRAGLVAV